MSTQDPRDRVPFQTMLALWGLRKIVTSLDEVPEAIVAMLDVGLKTRAQEVPSSLRFEAKRMGEGLGERLFELIACEAIEAVHHHDDARQSRYEDIGSAVLPQQAKKHKQLWRKAIKEGAYIQMEYVSATSGHVARRVRPDDVEGEYGMAYCFLRKEDRVFRFDRMFDVELITKQKRKSAKKRS